MFRLFIAVYIMANRRPSLYVGVTSNLPERVRQHKSDMRPTCFTARYRIHALVYFERYSSIERAIRREKVIKRMTRQEKLDLIASMNPRLEDLTHLL